MPSVDPTKTATLRIKYARAMNQRFRLLATDVRKSFSGGALTVNAEASEGEFDKETMAEKVASFELWLSRAIDERILDMVRRIPGRLGIRIHWQDVFIKSGYIRGVAAAEADLQAAGLLTMPVGEIEAMFRVPAHAETLELMTARVFQGLKGITDDMASKLSEIFSRALIEGVGPKVIAKRITDEIGSISRRRAMVMARTETIRVFNEARLNIIEQNGVDGVRADVELSIAKDGRVCPTCKSLEGKVYTVRAARGVIPVHPSCRCAWITAKQKDEQ